MFFLIVLLSGSCFAQAKKPSFEVVPLGVLGGLDESNLSSYLVGAPSGREYVCLDAGTVKHGIDVAVKNKVFSASAEEVLKRYIKGYLISHPHLDHVAGLVMNSPDDTSKFIYAMPYVADVIKKHYFSWESWANFTDEGDQPQLKKYHYTRLSETTDTHITNTGLRVQAYVLSHSDPYQSTAFLIQNKTDYLLYLGDTGPDEIEKSGNLKKLWEVVAPLIRNKSLKTIMIEVSFPNVQPDKQLFGHLTPRWLMKEMGVLSDLAGKENMLNFPVVITHMKPTANNINVIKTELKKINNLQLKLIYPVQGKKLLF